MKHQFKFIRKLERSVSAE